jgi:hypothetical protein
MSWVIAGMAALGVMQGAANQKKMERQNKYRAEAIKYSPWTGMGDPGEKELPDALSSGIQGAATGAMLGNAMGGSAGSMKGTQAAASSNMGTGMGQMAVTPEQQKWMMMNQSQGGPGYTMVG